MKQKLAVILLALFFLAYASIIGVSAFRIVSARADGIKSFDSDFPALGELVSSSLSQGKDVNSKIFVEQMRNCYAKSPRLQSLIIRDATLKVVYAIPSSAAGKPEPSETLKLPGILSGFVHAASTYSIMTRNASVAVPGASAVGLEAVYTILPTYQVQDIVGLSLLLTVALLLVSIFIRLAIFLSGEESDQALGGISQTAPEYAMAGDSIPPSPRLSEEFEVPSFEFDGGPQGGASRDEGPGAFSPSEPAGLYSPRSGLGWESYLSERLGSELSRCASLGLDCSFLLIECPGLKPDEPAYAKAAAAIREFFSFKDISFERGGSGFAVILPGKDIEQALQAARDFHPVLTDGARIGLSSRSGRRVDASVILQEAEAALERAGSSTDSPVIGFKADPDRYRNYVSGKL